MHFLCYSITKGSKQCKADYKISQYLPKSLKMNYKCKQTFFDFFLFFRITATIAPVIHNYSKTITTTGFILDTIIYFT